MKLLSDQQSFTILHVFRRYQQKDLMAVLSSVALIIDVLHLICQHIYNTNRQQDFAGLISYPPPVMQQLHHGSIAPSSWTSPPPTLPLLSAFVMAMTSRTTLLCKMLLFLDLTHIVLVLRSQSSQDQYAQCPIFSGSATQPPPQSASSLVDNSRSWRSACSIPTSLRRIVQSRPPECERRRVRVERANYRIIPRNYESLPNHTPNHSIIPLYQNLGYDSVRINCLGYDSVIY